MARIISMFNYRNSVSKKRMEHIRAVIDLDLRWRRYSKYDNSSTHFTFNEAQQIAKWFTDRGFYATAAATGKALSVPCLDMHEQVIRITVKEKGPEDTVKANEEENTRAAKVERLTLWRWRLRKKKKQIIELIKIRFDIIKRRIAKKFRKPSAD